MPDSASPDPILRSLESLIEDCALEASRRSPPPGGSGAGYAVSQTSSLSPAGRSSACYEIFRRACTPPRDELAWQALYDQYGRLVYKWLRPYAGEDTFQETFLRFFQAHEHATQPFTARYADLGSVLAYLKRCAVATRIAAWRVENRQRVLVDQIIVDFTLLPEDSSPAQVDMPFRELVLSRLNDKTERLVFELTYFYNLAPREIQARFPELFPDVQTVYRIQENFLKRLRRYTDLDAWRRD